MLTPNPPKPLNLKRMGRHKVLFVMATEAEFGAKLKARITPFMCGVGPVEAAAQVAAGLAGLNERPDMVVSLGSAGSRGLDQGAIYEVSGVSYRDMDASAFGFEKGTTPFLDLPRLVPVETLILGVPKASLSTGANVVSGDGYDTVAEDMVDMESFAILRVCQMYDLRFVGLRGISDGAKPVEGLSDWTALLGVIDARLADAVDALETALIGLA
ncbi:MAG: 5'-methylthioadenosine/S-adenosylhomocysteine nucleosidase [Pseudomonadota bacterium]